MVCQKKTFRVETNIVRCEKYKPKGKTYKLLEQTEKNDRGTSPPPPSRSHSMGTSTSPAKHNEIATQANIQTQNKKMMMKKTNHPAAKVNHARNDKNNQDFEELTSAQQKQLLAKLPAKVDAWKQHAAHIHQTYDDPLGHLNDAEFEKIRARFNRDDMEDNRRQRERRKAEEIQRKSIHKKKLKAKALIARAHKILKHKNNM